MKKQNSKQRLFEVMGRLDKTFKPKLNENFVSETKDDYICYNAGMDNYEIEKYNPEISWHNDPDVYRGSYKECEREKENKEIDAYRFRHNMPHKSYGDFAPDYMNEEIKDESLNEETYSDYLNTHYSSDGMDDYYANKRAMETAISLYDIGQNLFKLGRTEEAEKYRQEALQQNDYGDDDLPPYTRQNVNEKDDKLIQKAVDPEHKGYCTPMTKDTCIPHRKALAKRFKKDIDEENLTEANSTGSPINKYVYFALNYPYDFIEQIWADNPNLVQHLKSKFKGYYDSNNTYGTMNQFYVNLDSDNQQKLENWILANYNG